MHHLLLPVVVDAPGQYVTRGGDVVTIERITSHRGWGYKNRAEGQYSNGVAECWSARGGRVLPWYLSQNDIVAKAQG
jgi:hypothetical protein